MHNILIARRKLKQEKGIESDEGGSHSKVSSGR